MKTLKWRRIAQVQNKRTLVTRIDAVGCAGGSEGVKSAKGRQGDRRRALEQLEIFRVCGTASATWLTAVFRSSCLSLPKHRPLTRVAHKVEKCTGAAVAQGNSTFLIKFEFRHQRFVILINFGSLEKDCIAEIILYSDFHPKQMWVEDFRLQTRLFYRTIHYWRTA